jgi:Predicted Zn-dependent protease (DUF2268)
MAVLRVSAQDSPAPTIDVAVRPAIHVEDVDRFFAVYDAADGRPTAEALQRDYLDRGSEGLRHLARARTVTGVRIAEMLVKNPGIYAEAKACLAVLPRVRTRVQAAVLALRELYPQARLPPITIAVGRGQPVAIGSPIAGIQIGLEALCAVDWLNSDLEDRFVHVIAHEYAHVQQAHALVDDEAPTVLERSLVEGVAELVAELTSGEVAYSHLAGTTRGREKEIESAFFTDRDSADLSRWLDNSTLEAPGDLGYWVGYRIAKAYYQRAADKREALRDILAMTDPKDFLAKSGWQPGMRMPDG